MGDQSGPEGELERYRAALERIATCPEQRFPNPSFLAHYLRNMAVQALAGEVSDKRPCGEMGKAIRIRHRLLHFEKRADCSLGAVEMALRMGDLVAMMLCAGYMKRHEGCRVVFQLMDEIHKCMKAEVLFRDLIDEVLTEEGPNFGLLDPELPEIYDPGPLWSAATFYYRKFGGSIVPRLCLDPAHYQGPEMPWGEYIVFHPLFDPQYNTARGMSDAFVNNLCDRLHGAFGGRVLVITDRPERIHSKVRLFTSENLYDLIVLASRAKVFLGGDTGFSHMAAAGRVEHLFALYGANYLTDFPTMVKEICQDDLLDPFAAWGKFWGVGMDTRPKWDPASTHMHFHVLQDNGLPEPEMDAIVQELQGIFATKKC